MSEQEYNEMAFDPRQYNEHEELTEEEKAIAEAGKEAYDDLIDYERLTLGAR